MAAPSHGLRSPGRNHEEPRVPDAVTEKLDPLWNRWEEVDALLAAAMALDRAERERLLDARAEVDRELVVAVRSLLASTDVPETRLDRVSRAVWNALHRRRGDRA